jgi:hypothetical protein
MIVEWTRGHLIYRKGDRTVTISGEMTFPPLNRLKKPKWYGDLKALERWDPPHDNERISDEERAAIIHDIKQSSAKTVIVVFD